ncbi:unnamed protein product [Cuscuta campestris]|uniref:Uncharacterized protein n=1 Tax=Cuscuta campestris TaxID=132261 RepID=A0A484LGI9_9ASTE|nr:unnamed protein product [Cuscuta campestris]
MMFNFHNGSEERGGIEAKDDFKDSKSRDVINKIQTVFYGVKPDEKIKFVCGIQKAQHVIFAHKAGTMKHTKCLLISPTQKTTSTHRLAKRETL